MTDEIASLSRDIWRPGRQPVSFKTTRTRSGGPLSPANMFKTDKLKALVSERLTAAAEEVFSIFEQTIKEYEEAVFRSKQQIDHQRSLAGWKGKFTSTQHFTANTEGLQSWSEQVHRLRCFQSSGPLPERSARYTGGAK